MYYSKKHNFRKPLISTNRLQTFMTIQGRIHKRKTSLNQSLGQYLMKSSFYRLLHSKYSLLMIQNFNKTPFHSHLQTQ